ncbi:MAG TPA: hypothetical protein VM736_04180 [Gemmatimonadales bacterium]|nr:hypothetical protein [Gemmatimonadales bacterium]
MAAMFFAALVQQPSPPSADTAAGRPCTIQVDSIGGKYSEVAVGPHEKNYYAGGGVLAHCLGTGSTLSADSVAYYQGIGRFDMLGPKTLVHIRDTAITLDAVTALYHLRQEWLEAHKNVVAVNRSNGSVLRGPNLIYYRAVKGVRDTLEMYASGRPTIDYRSGPDSAEPYVIVADRVRFKGNDRMWGGGSVTIDRSDFAARGDSLALDQSAGKGVLVGNPQVAGKGSEAYTLTGTRIELGLQGRELRLVKALGNGVATSGDWRLTADTIHLHIDRKRLQRANAWGPKDSVRARAVSARTTIRADSLALDVPEQVLTEARGFGHTYATSKRDSSAAQHRDSSAASDVDWISGDSLTARWRPVADSASRGGKPKTQLHELLARGGARVFTHVYNRRDSTLGPSLNYTRGAVIDAILLGDKIDTVRATGQADGVHLEPRPPAPPDSTKGKKRAPAPPDSTKARKKVSAP